MTYDFRNLDPANSAHAGEASISSLIKIPPFFLDFIANKY